MGRILDMQKRSPRPDWVRRMNAMGDAVGGAEQLIPLDVADLVARARESTGMDDFGGLDGDWRSRLEAYVATVEETAALHVVGRLMIREEILRCLRSRLLLTRANAVKPSIAEERIEAPMAVVGPARSGTSILFELLSLDPEARGPLAWEATHPVPTADDPAALVRMTECEQEFWEDVSPVMAAIHEQRSDIPVECISLQMPSFAGAYWWIVAHVPGWVPDMAAAMQYHRAVLQTLQHGRPRSTWVLKTPIYLGMIDLLFATYPDAWLVRTHRDPAKTAPSGLSTLANVRWLRSDHVDLDALGGPVDGAAGGIHDQMLQVDTRRAAGELPDRFVDVHFASLMRDPVATIRAAYERMDREFTDDYAELIREYLAKKPRSKAGAHRYTPEEWGFELGAMREEARPYTDHFKVELED